MGQGQNTSSNPLLQDWRIYPNQPNTFFNEKQNEFAEMHCQILSKNQQLILKKRLTEHHNFIIRILYYEPVDRFRSMNETQKYCIYSQKCYPLSVQRWQPVTSALSILKGFRRLSSNYGMMRVFPSMIKINHKKQIRVWVNQNMHKNQVLEVANSEQQMLADIVKIVMMFDCTTGALMVGCRTINDAINQILKSIADNKTQVNFSNRTSKNQKLDDKMNKSGITGFQSQLKDKDTSAQHQPKINFRSTKQTEDDSLKPFNQSNQSNTKSIKSNNVQFSQQNQQQSHTEYPKNYLQNVAVPKSPTFINLDRYPQPKNIPASSYTNPFKGFQSQSNPQNYSHQHHHQQHHHQQQHIQGQTPTLSSHKYSSIQFNSSQPINTKTVTNSTAVGARPYKPIQHKNPTLTNSQSMQTNYSTFSSQLSPTYQRQQQRDREQRERERDSERFADKYGDLIHNRKDFHANYQSNSQLYMPQRKSNLNKNYLQRLQNSQEQIVNHKSYTQNNEKPQINTSRQFMQTHSFTRPRNLDYPPFIDANRTKTQQFHTSQSNDFNIQPSRFRTNNYLQNPQLVSGTKMIAQSTIAAVPRMNTSPMYARVPDSPKFSQYQRNIELQKDSSVQKIMDNSNSNSNSNQQDQSIPLSTQDDEKKQNKLKQAQKIKEQMSSLGILGIGNNNNNNNNNNGKQLTNDKSLRDLLIKQKIQEKNKKHEDLKCAITKLLSE